MKACQSSKAFRAAKPFSELINRGKADKLHQQQRAKHRDRIKRRLTTRGRRVKPSQIIAYGVEVKAQEYESGIKAERIEAARAALEPGR
jgi:hypothetical protein